MIVREFSAKLWVYPGQAAWHFVTLPAELGEEIHLISAGQVRRGFGSVRVEVHIGSSTWDTSIFPDKESGSYFLPIKKQVRLTEDMTVNDQIDVQLVLKEY